MAECLGLSAAFEPITNANTINARYNDFMDREKNNGRTGAEKQKTEKIKVSDRCRF